MEDWQKDMMRFFSEREDAETAAQQTGREQRQQATNWLQSVVRPAFDAVLSTMAYGGRQAKPITYLDATPDPYAIFPVKWKNSAEFTYELHTVVDADGLKAKVMSTNAKSKYSEPTNVSDITVEDLRDDLIETYKASFPPIPAVI